MEKRPLFNVSNNIHKNKLINSKRGIDTDNENVITKKLKNIDADQENIKGSVLKKILLVNNRILENITNSNLKNSLYKKKEDNFVSTDQLKKDNKLSRLSKIKNSENSNEEKVSLKRKLDENSNKLILHKNKKRIDFSKPLDYYVCPKDLPVDVEDFDKKNLNDINSEAQFAHDIFEYYFEREKKFIIKDYINDQPEISRSMRSILVDWIVELQETLHLNHETIYLSVKIVDHYLSKQECSRSLFQLLGCTAVFIATKYDTRFNPQIKSFLYICDNAYTKEQMIIMERSILKNIDFNLGFSLSYRFLRRFARCAGLSMETLTFARYILEMCLLEYDFIKELDSKIAAACLLLVFKSKTDLNLKWTRSLEYYSHYKEEDLLDLMYKINSFMNKPLKQSIKTIKEKYSTRTYFQVAKNKLLPVD